MCGLVAVLGKSAGTAIKLDRALRALSYRGVRSQVSETPHGLVGHARLPIVGLGQQHDQPVQVPGWTIAFVGELLDFRERKPHLSCDVEDVVQTWVESGYKGFLDRDGFWAIVAQNHVTGEMHALVDYLAQKPLYYRTDINAVASEIDALLEFGDVSPDEEYFSTVAKFGYSPYQHLTPYKEIMKMPPGSHMVMIGGDKGFRHVDVTVVDRIKEVDPTDLKDEIIAATRRRVTSSDVPVGCLVSGGVDSSIVYTLAKRSSDWVRPFYCAATPNPDELGRVEKVAPGAQIVCLPHTNIHRALDYMQEPIDLGSVQPQVALSDAMVDKVTVCLTGDGADEMFGGYGRAMRYDSQRSDVWSELVNYHLPRLDRVMMRNRIEVRSPFLARRVVQMAHALPYTQRRDKLWLREAFKYEIGPDLAFAPKIPLRTRNIEENREQVSIDMINELYNRRWGRQWLA